MFHHRPAGRGYVGPKVTMWLSNRTGAPLKHSGRTGRLVRIVTLNPFILAALAAISVFACAGCSSAPAFTANFKPRLTDSTSSRLGIVVARFADPPSAHPRWDNIGADFSRLLIQRMRERAPWDVSYESSPPFSLAEFETGSAHEHARKLSALRDRFPSAYSIIGGSVTRFDHVQYNADSASASHHQAGAVVQITLIVADLVEQKVWIDRSIDAAAWAQSSGNEPYAKLRFDSPGFLVTPLGLATGDALRDSIKSIEHYAPSPQRDPVRIVELLDVRRVRLESDALESLRPGETLFVSAFDAATARYREVRDRHTGAPLKAIVEARGLYPSALLLGPWPAHVPIRNGALSRTMPASAGMARR